MSAAMTTSTSTSTSTISDAGEQCNDAVQLLKAHKAAVSALWNLLFSPSCLLSHFRCLFVDGTLLTIPFWLLGKFYNCMRTVEEAHRSF